MRKYEMLYILSTKLADETKDAIIAKFENVVSANGGTVEKVDKQGVKKFAYAIGHKNEGVYVMYNLELDAAKVNEITKTLNITDDVVRTMFIKK